MAGCKHSKPQALLLGNGLSAVSRELGVAIDAFAGIIYGFDFVLLNRPIHYCHEGEEKPYDNPLPEWRFFQNHIMAERVKHFALDPERESIPIVRQPTPCGNDRNLQAGRESCQGGWYDWIGRQARGLEILDVGAGMCDGMRIMERQGAKVTGFDIDSRLKGLHPNLIVSENLACFGNDAFDVVTCIDVIEHVIEDRVLLEHMLRIGRQAVYVSTPNASRSYCQNTMHCREYTIAQFWNIFHPAEITVGSPDGFHNLRLLLDENVSEVAVDQAFIYEGDGKVWAHFCAVWHM